VLKEKDDSKKLLVVQHPFRHCCKTRVTMICQKELCIRMKDKDLITNKTFVACQLPPRQWERAKKEFGEICL